MHRPKIRHRAAALYRVLCIVYILVNTYILVSDLHTLLGDLPPKKVTSGRQPVDVEYIVCAYNSRLIRRIVI